MTEDLNSPAVAAIRASVGDQQCLERRRGIVEPDNSTTGPGNLATVASDGCIFRGRILIEISVTTDLAADGRTFIGDDTSGSGTRSTEGHGSTGSERSPIRLIGDRRTAGGG